MSFADFLETRGKKICKDHYLHMVQVSKVDGKISDAEMEMLHKKGRKFGLTDPEIDHIINSEAENQYNPPYSLIGKFIHLYNVSQIILADEEVTEKELKMIRRIATESGFNDKTIERLIKLLFEGIRKGDDEDKLFNEFKKNHLFKE